MKEFDEAYEQACGEPPLEEDEAYAVYRALSIAMTQLALTAADMSVPQRVREAAMEGLKNTRDAVMGKVVL
jgi:hypothetical protein